VEGRSEAPPLNLSDLFLIVRDVRLLGGLSTPALRLKHHVQTGTSRVDGQVLSDSSTVRADLWRLVVCSVVHFYIGLVERTAASTHRHI